MSIGWAGEQCVGEWGRILQDGRVKMKKIDSSTINVTAKQVKWDVNRIHKTIQKATETSEGIGSYEDYEDTDNSKMKD